ncbi:uncharacterized protein QC761_0023400 [Podospora bellae-mahoneyi]|uniref:Uncharacterized protein n=1 Tax=Podospora bellae-mahoneyi TaxID=2093777 RepID=A0ABR0G1L2_9PEZI|nr:hypothetical protein QC761_0023400 [Podospora bellae-mahoneyi]
MFPCSSDLFDFPLCCIILSAIFDLFLHICRWIQLSQLDLPWTQGLSLDMPWTTIWTILYLTGLARIDVLCHVTPSSLSRLLSFTAQELLTPLSVGHSMFSFGHRMYLV